MEFIFSPILFIAGLFFGSFLLVLSDRLPRDENVISGRSYCESCKKPLEWYELIPVLSYLVQMGKCRKCGAHLSGWYPVSEITTASLFAIIPFLLPTASMTLYAFVLIMLSVFIVIFIADWKYGIIPFPIVAIGILSCIIYYGVAKPQEILFFVFTGLLTASFFFLIFFFTKGKGMGFGDVVYAFLMGLFLGFPGVLVGLYLAFLTGAVVSLILILLKKKKLRGDTIAFGPFLVLATALAFILEDYFLQLYQGVFF